MSDALSRYVLSQAEPWLIRILLAGGLGAFLFSARLRASLPSASAKAWRAIILISLAGAALRYWGTGPRPIVLFDEYCHLSIAETLNAAGRLCELKRGSTAQPEICELPPWPGGLHTPLAALFGAVGPSESAAFYFAFLIGTLSIPLIFLSALTLFERPPAAVLSALLLGLWEIHALFSGPIETNLLSSFAMLLVLGAVGLYRRDPSCPSALFLVSMAGWAMLIRFENIVLLPLIPWALSRFPNRKWSRFLPASPLLFAAIVISALHLRHGLSGHHGLLNLSFWRRFPTTFLENMGFWVDPARNPWYVFGLFSVGAWKMLRDRNHSWLLSWGACYLMIYSLFSWSFARGLEGGRFALVLIPIYLLVGGFGADALLGFVRAKSARLALVGTLIAILLHGRLTRPPDAAALESAKRAEKGRAFLDRSAAAIPSGAYFVTYSPDYVACFSSRKVILPHDLDAARGPLVLAKDITWYTILQRYPDAERELRERFRFRRLAILDGNRPEGPDNFSIYSLEAAP